MLTQILSTTSILAALILILAVNPIHAVLSLVAISSMISILIIGTPSLGLEFMPILFIIVYVGAIAILFLFVIMMLNIKTIEVKDNSTRYLPTGILIGVIFLIEIYLLVSEELQKAPAVDTIYWNWELIFKPQQNLIQISQYLYTDGYELFIIASIVLLVAMIAAIVLTLHHEDLELVKRQDIFEQIQTRQELPVY